MDLVPQTRVSWGLGIRKSGQRSLHLLKCDYRGNVKYYSKTSRCLPEKVPFGQVRGFCFIFKPSMYTFRLLFTLFILTLNTTGYIYFHIIFIFIKNIFILCILVYRKQVSDLFYCNLHIPWSNLWLLTNQMTMLQYWDWKVTERKDVKLVFVYVSISFHSQENFYFSFTFNSLFKYFSYTFHILFICFLFTFYLLLIYFSFTPHLLLIYFSYTFH